MVLIYHFSYPIIEPINLVTEKPNQSKIKRKYQHYKFLILFKNIKPNKIYHVFELNIVLMFHGLFQDKVEIF